MKKILFIAALMFNAAADASLLTGYDVQSYDQALAQTKGRPDRHVMLYFGQYFCAQCQYTRNVLTGSDILARYKPNYAVVDIDIRNPGNPESRKVVRALEVRWAPTLVFIDSNGKIVLRLPGGLNNEKEAILLNEFVSQKLYLKTYFHDYVKANFNSRSPQRI